MTFENRLAQQKMVHSAFEKKYTITVMDRIANIEKSIENITLEQGMLSTYFRDNRLNDSVERISINDSLTIKT